MPNFETGFTRRSESDEDQVQGKGPEEGHDFLEDFLKTNRSGSQDSKPEKIRGRGASGTTDEARDLF